MVTKRGVLKTIIISLFGVVLAASQNPPSRTRASGNYSNTDVAIGMEILQGIGCKKVFSRDRYHRAVAYERDTLVWKFPWMALLVYSDGMEGNTRCGGTLITSRYVLTAAHCLRNSIYTLVSVRLGEYDTAEDPDCIGNARRQVCGSIQEIDVEKIIYHKDFNMHTGSNDIALIRLKENVFPQKNISPIRLPISNKLMARKGNSKIMTIAGWGLLETGLRARILQVAPVPIVDNSVCQKFYLSVKISNKQFCAKSENRTYSCVGDSGGPMFDKAPCESGYTCTPFVQFGIISYGSKECGSIHPEVFTKVSSYIPWIAGNIRS